MKMYAKMKEFGSERGRARGTGSDVDGDVPVMRLSSNTFCLEAQNVGNRKPMRHKRSEWVHII